MTGGGVGEVADHRGHEAERLVRPDPVVEGDEGPDLLVETEDVGDLLAVEMLVLRGSG